MLIDMRFWKSNYQLFNMKLWLAVSDPLKQKLLICLIACICSNTELVKGEKYLTYK